MDREEPPEHHEFHGPRQQATRIPDGKPNPFYARHAAKLAKLREECAVIAFGQRRALLEEAEWRGLPIMLRFFVLTEAGMADPDDALRRGWREYPDAERSAIRATLRAWIRELDALSALTL
ncbi:hypothetical protein M0765_000695 [Variovorax sp. S2]|uniref:hypothetical protein n=1 Tax=Variovorax sp. S12S4 TaxID=3029170 RepID=UPI00215C32A2|nr:hypothetical protein [Variovorax sp. S12S4]MCR8956297.1 hypothetical protein [Variovorax sp. S12S4]